MRLTWSFYPKNQPSVTLTVIYVPELDPEKLVSGGYLDTPNNVAYVDWATFRRFDSADLASRKDAFQQLTPLADAAGFKSLLSLR